MNKYDYSHHNFLEVFKYKNIYLGLFGLALSSTIGLSNVSPALAQTVSSTIKARSMTTVDEAILERFAVAPEPEYWRLARDNAHTNRISIQAIAVSQSDSAEANLKLVRRISLTCFLLLFIPLGLFYPLFLFYRRLLDRHYDLGYSQEDESDRDSANFAKDSSPSLSSIPIDTFLREKESQMFPVTPLRKVKLGDRQNNAPFTTNSSSKKSQRRNADPASASTTVSKLQIAFSPQAGSLRPKLSQVVSSIERNHEVTELLRQTISVLLAQQYWTHVSYSSDSLSGEKVRAEFDLVSHLERNKCLTRELSSVNRDRHSSSFFSSDEDSYSYVVVTLILCTIHNSPLFGKIHTKAQLIEELVELSQIENDRLLKFELLWNPQSEAEYISNEQLLTQYSDLIRLL